jgi:hypothetical protein
VRPTGWNLGLQTTDDPHDREIGMPAIERSGSGSTARFAVLAAAAIAAAGCGHGASDRVREGDFAQLGAAQAAYVDGARGALTQAQEELARARSRIPEARREEELAEADRKAADAALERARKELEGAEARRRAADARREYAEKLRDAREADEEVARRRVDLASARVELAKLQALEQASAAGTGQYEKVAFYERVTGAQRKVEEAQAEARQLDEESRAQQRRWEELARKAPAAR